MDDRLVGDVNDAVPDLINAMTHPAMLVDETGQVLHVNGAARSQGKDTLETMIGDAFGSASITGDGLDPRARVPIALPFRDTPVDMDRKFKTGTWRRVTSSGTRLRLSSGRRCFLFTAEDISARKHAEREVARNLDRERVLGTIMRVALSPVPQDEFLAIALDQVLSIRWLALGERGALFVLDPGDPRRLRMAAQRELSSGVRETCAFVEVGTCLCGRAARDGEPQFASCVDAQHEVTYPGMRPHGHYVVPMCTHDKLYGVLCLYLNDGHTRDPAEESFLTAIATALASGLERRHKERNLRQAVERLRKTLDGVIGVLSRVTELRDAFTAGHQRRVARIAVAVARAMGLAEARVEGLYAAALVHDVGKLSAPADLLSRPGKLSPAEFGLVKLHAESGHSVLKQVEFDWPIAEIIHQHHERLDGSGYPRGFKGQEILLEARILGAADVVEAMTSHRPHRPAYPMEAALEELRAKRGTLYDSEVVDACVRVCSTDEFREAGD